MSSVRIGLNATAFNDRPSGARQRFVGIYGALVRQRPDWTFVVYEPADCRVADWFDGAPNVVARRTPIPSVGAARRVLHGFGYWRRALKADALDLFEDFVLPLTRHPNRPTVLTIHDIRSLYEGGGRVERMVRRRLFRHAFAHADRIVAVSNAVADEIRAFYPPARVSTVYNGVDPTAFAHPGDAAVTAARARYGLPERYLVTVGHIEARKNLPLLVDALAVLRDRGLVRPLAIVGNDGGQRDAVRARIAAHRLDSCVTIVEHADDATVRALYAGCRQLVFPSRYEGFGIPILEAMAAGKPMALADTPVFRELTQGQGAYFPIDDPAAAADTIERVWSDADERTRQVRFGTERLGDFGFDRLAGEVASNYQALVEPGGADGRLPRRVAMTQTVIASGGDHL